jgi:hypothetical protein
MADTDKPLTLRRSFLRRQAWWLVLGSILVVVFIGPWWHTWIDDTPPSGQPPAALNPALLTPGSLQAGVAAVEITDLAIGRPLAGYGSRVFTPTSEVADPIFARALVLDNGQQRVAIVTADILLFNPTLSSQVAETLAALDGTWKREDIFFGATHTHSGPSGYAGAVAEQIALGWRDQELTDQLAQRIAECIRKAATTLQPTEMAHAALEVDPAYIQNRTKSDDPANRWLDLLFLRNRNTTELLASVAIFSAHATARSSSDLRISGDYPGEMVRGVEKALGGTCLFLAGSVGSMKPGAPVSRDQWTESLGAGLRHYAEILHAEAKNYQHELPLALLAADVELPTPQVKLTTNLRLSPFLARRLLPSQVPIQGLRFGNVLLLGTPCDFSGVLAEELRSSTPEMTTIVTSFNGDYCGYILPESYYDLDKYEA